MSLRLRLLLAVGAIAMVALVVADFATYSALRSSLYKQVDQSLAQNRGRRLSGPDRSAGVQRLRTPRFRGRRHECGRG